MNRHEGNPLVRGTIHVAVICVAVRIAAAIIEPVLPVVLTVAVVVLVGALLFRGGHYRR